jgi:hypothetical protein
MKQITNKTILKQGDKTYQPVEVDGVVYWIDYYTKKGDFWCIDIDKKIFKDQTHFPISIGQRLIIAQSQPRIEGIPVVSLDRCVQDKAYKHTEKLILTSEGRTQRWWGFIVGYESNPNQYTQKDIDKAIELAQESGEHGYGHVYNKEQIHEQINSISILEVDSEFQILSYK